MARAEKLFACAILTVFLAADAAIIAVAVSGWSAMVPDFYGFWSTAQFLQSHRAASAYDIFQLGPFQQALNPNFTAVFPAPYSPVFLLLIRPLAWLNYSAAHLLWAGTTLIAFLLAARTQLRGSAWLLAMLVMPVTVLGVIYGQTGFLSAALMIAALHWMQTHPGRAGLCLALLAFKPQLALLMPVVLLARRDGKTLVATIAWLCALVAVSSLVLGWSIWLDWLVALRGHGQLMEESRTQLIGIMATITSAALSLGGSLPLARIMQAVVALLVGIAVWFGWRRADRSLAIAATLVGSFLVTPYAFVYDSPAAMCGALLFLQTVRQRGEALSGIELAAIVTTLAAPLFILTSPPPPPVAPLAFLALFVVIARRALQSQ